MIIYVKTDDIIINSENYHPDKCTINNYYFTFLFDKNINNFKVHGLWPNECNECITCSYPTCCNTARLNYTKPIDKQNFLENYWYNIQSISQVCNITRDVILFEHEYYKHGSCLDIKNTTDYINIIEILYNKYYKKYVKNKCINHNELWLKLDSKLEYNNVLCK